jgi:hypothetical protein
MGFSPGTYLYVGLGLSYILRNIEIVYRLKSKSFVQRPSFCLC